MASPDISLAETLTRDVAFVLSDPAFEQAAAQPREPARRGSTRGSVSIGLATVLLIAAVTSIVHDDRGGTRVSPRATPTSAGPPSRALAATQAPLRPLTQTSPVDRADPMPPVAMRRTATRRPALTLRLDEAEVDGRDTIDEPPPVLAAVEPIPAPPRLQPVPPIAAPPVEPAAVPPAQEPAATVARRRNVDAIVSLRRQW